MNLPKVRKIFKWIGYILLSLIIILFLLMNFAMPFNESDEALLSELKQDFVEINIDHLTIDHHHLRVVNTHKKGNIPDTTVVFIHGAPGSLSDFKAFLIDSNLLDRYNLLAIDRPGYGGSDPGNPEASIEKQADLLLKAIQHYSSKQLLLVGHSYGGPIVGKMALNSPEKIIGLLLLAPVNEPKSEPRYKISYLAIYPPIKWLIPGVVYTAAIEKLAHPKEIEKFSPHWQEITCKTIQMHGDKDFLAPPSNMGYTQKRIPAQYFELIRLPEENHFLPWTQFSRITHTLTTKF